MKASIVRKVVAVLAVAGGSLVVLLAAASGPTRSSAEPATPLGAVASVPTPAQPTLLEAFRNDSLPQGVTFPAEFRDSVTKQHGARLDEAKLVRQRDGEQFWLIPARDGKVCDARLIPGPAGPDIGFGCGATPAPGGYGSLGSMSGMNIESLLTGVVGDNVTKIVSGTQSFPVEHNMFVIPKAELAGRDLVLVSRDGSTQTINR